MKNRIAVLVGLIFSLFLNFTNVCHSETIVKVVVPNAFKSNEDIISLSGSYCLDPNNSNGESLYFTLESHVGSIMVWSAIIPTLSDVDSLFVSVELNENSVTDTLHDIPLTKIDLGKGDVTFFRWIFNNQPNSTSIDIWDELGTMGADGEIYVAIRADLVDSFYIQFGDVLEDLLYNFAHISKGKVDHKNCFNYIHSFDILDYIDPSEDRIIKKKLKTSSIRVLENIPFYRDYKHFDYDWDYDGEYYKINLLIE